MARVTRDSPCSRRHCRGSAGGKVAGCGRSRLRFWIVEYGMNHVFPRHRRSPPLPPGDVRFILVGHAYRQPIQGRLPAWAEVKDELLAFVQEPRAVDRLVVADGKVAVQPGLASRVAPVDGDRLDPVNGVLQHEVRACGVRDIECGPGFAGRGPHVEKQGTSRSQGASRGAEPCLAPTPDRYQPRASRCTSYTAPRGCTAVRSQWRRRRPGPGRQTRRARRRGRSATRRHACGRSRRPWGVDGWSRWRKPRHRRLFSTRATKASSWPSVRRGL